MTLSTGSRVTHKTRKDTFGPGTIKHINETTSPASVLVQWDHHTRNTDSSKHAANETHVKITSLTEVI